MTDKLTPPFTAQSNASTFWLTDANGTPFAYTYWSDKPIVGTGDAKPTREAARKFTAYLAKLPGGVLTPADQETRDALAKFAESIGKPVAEAAGVLLRDALISVGDLPLGSANRGRAAGGKRRGQRDESAD